MTLKLYFKTASFILLGILITLWPAFYNHYVFFFTDSELYINSGNSFSALEDRSFVYGFFVGITSLFHSLWFTIIIQAVLFNIVCYSFIKQFVFNSSAQWIYLLTVVILDFSSALPWDVCYIMPDIFSSMSIMLLYMLLFKFPQNKISAFFLVLAYLICAQMHISYMLAHSVVISLFLLFRIISIPFLVNRVSIKHTFFLFLIVVMNMQLFAIEKRVLGSGKAFTNVSHVFLLAKLVENGVLKIYLDAECGKKNYEICKYKDSLSLHNLSGTFIWVPSSAFNRTGGWHGNHDEYNTILKDIVTTPKYLVLYSYQIAIETVKMLGCYKIFTSFYSFPRDGWGPHPAVVKYYPNEIGRYDASRQNTNTLYAPLEEISYSYLALMILSFAVVLFLFKNDFATSFFIGCALVFNAVITGGLTGVHNRYATRQDWLLIVLAILLIYTTWQKRQSILRVS